MELWQFRAAIRSDSTDLVSTIQMFFSLCMIIISNEMNVDINPEHSSWSEDPNELLEFQGRQRGNQGKPCSVSSAQRYQMGCY